MGYYQGLNEKFETLNKTKTEPGFKSIEGKGPYGNPAFSVPGNTASGYPIPIINTASLSCVFDVTQFETHTKLADLINQLQLNVDESKTSEMDDNINKIDEKIKYIQGEIKELSRYNSRLIPSSFQANKVRDPQSESFQITSCNVLNILQLNRKDPAKASKLVGRTNHINIMGRSSERSSANTELKQNIVPVKIPVVYDTGHYIKFLFTGPCK